MKKIINLILFSVFIIGGGGIVNGATYPIKPVRMLVPSPPGGGTDTLARIVRENLQQDWPQPVIVENRGGASGRIAALAVAKATAVVTPYYLPTGESLQQGSPFLDNWHMTL